MKLVETIPKDLLSVAVLWLDAEKHGMPYWEDLRHLPEMRIGLIRGNWT